MNSDKIENKYNCIVNLINYTNNRFDFNMLSFDPQFIR